MSGEEVFALDLPGHGESPLGGEATIGGYAERLIDWARAGELARAVWVGHSMGSAIALAIALRVPNLVQGLVLVGAAGSFRVNPNLLELLGERKGFEEAVRLIIKWSFSRQASPQLVALAAERMAEVRPEVLYQDFLACDRFDETARLGELRSPTLVIAGREDRMVPLEQSEQLAGALAEAQLEVVEGAGHMVMLERPSAVAAAMKAFLRDLPGVT